MFLPIFIGILLNCYLVEAKQITYDDKSMLSNNNIKLKQLSNIEHLDNTLRTYQNFAKKCRLCQFPETMDEFVCRETPCKTPEELARSPIIKKVKSPDPCEVNSKHENSCAYCVCDSSGQHMDCTVTKTVPLCLLYMK